MSRKEKNYNISAKDKNGIRILLNVPEIVYLYIRQLEGYIKYPQHSKLKEIYPNLFLERKDIISPDKFYKQIDDAIK